MIEKLYTSDFVDMVNKINEIIDFLNNTNAMRVQDGRDISVTGGYVEWPTINTITTAIDEIELLETITEPGKYCSEVYDDHRKNVCAHCLNSNCMRGRLEIDDCLDA